MIRRQITLASVSVCLLLSGCAGNPPDNPPGELAPRAQIGWSRQDWRICEADASCPRPTPKTVTLAPPPPVAEKFLVPVAPKPSLAKADQPAHVHFDLARSIPTLAGLAALEALLERIQANQFLRIVGHTDDLGSLRFNERLAQRRARFVARWLKGRGVKNPIEIEARAQCCYVATNDSAEGRAANRRAEIHFSTTRKEIAR